MAINRAKQTWPADVVTNVETHNIDLAYARACSGTCADCGAAPDQCVEKPCKYWEPEDEFERRQRGSASTIAALIIVAMFAGFAVAVFPLLQTFAGK